MTDDKTLVECCLNDNPRAHTIFYKRYSDRLYPLCLKFAKNHADADDFLQEGFLRVFANLKYYGFKGSLDGWTYKTFLRAVINYYFKQKKFKNEVGFPLDGCFQQYCEDCLSVITSKELMRLVNNLPDGYKKVFILNTMEGYTHKEIGRILKISDNTSKSQLARARNSLQKAIRQQRMEELRHYPEYHSA
jgi:RNA polymerase sigma-70 factor (ECF subfamily)